MVLGEALRSNTALNSLDLRANDIHLKVIVRDFVTREVTHGRFSLSLLGHERAV